MSKRKVLVIYSLIGIGFGLCFPLGAWILDSVLKNLTLSISTIFLLHEQNPLHYMIDSAPLFLGIFAFIGGLNQSKSVDMNLKLNSTLDKLKLEHHKNTDLFNQLKKDHQEMINLFSVINNAKDVLTNNETSLNKTMEDVLNKEFLLQNIMTGVNDDLVSINQYFKDIIDKITIDNNELKSILDITLHSATTIKNQHASNEMVLLELDYNNQRILTLTQQAEEAKKIIEYIHSISAQINLLSLNASIEASRAGESGKGFAVVANEIKLLSGQTDSATKNIESIISSLSDSIVQMDQNMNKLTNKSKLSISTSNDVSNTFVDVNSGLDRMLANFNNMQEDMKRLNITISDINEHVTQSRNVFVELSTDIKVSEVSLSKNNEQIHILAKAIDHSTFKELD